MTETNRYDWWHEALEGRLGPIQETRPESGFYRIKWSGAWKPVAIWRDLGGVLHMRIGDTTIHGDDIGVRWLLCAKHPVLEKAYRDRLATGRWPSDPAEGVEPADMKVDEAAPPPLTRVAAASIYDYPPAAPAPREAVPGDNSGDLASFRAMAEELTGDVEESKAHFLRNPVRTKTDADLCENWRGRLAKAAKALDLKRRGELKPLEDAEAEINARYKPTLQGARAQIDALDALGQAWVRAERERLRKEREDEARAKFEAERAAAEAEAERIEAERAKLERDDPVAAAHTTKPEAPAMPEALEPVVAAPKVMIGTGERRRGVRAEVATATIMDLGAATAYYVGIKHPELVVLIQKLANQAARAKATVPGCKMSWESGQAA